MPRKEQIKPIEDYQEEYKKLTENGKYSQVWEEYNKAQTKEKLLFYRLLNELLDILPEREYTFGRPRKSLRDMIFCCMIKIYNNTSSRRIISDLELAKKAGYIEQVPHFNTLLNYFDDAGMWVILNYLIKISGLPLKQVEEAFAVDASGFGTGRFDRWVNVRNKSGKPRKGFVKAHICCGVKTNIVTAVEITRENVHDNVLFGSLVDKTHSNFYMKELSADKAYSSRDNLELVNQLGAMPFIPFKKNVTGKSRGSPTWAKMYKIFATKYIEFAEHYHKRSNVETVFSMIKKKFGDNVRCKSLRSQTNEVLCKILSHNLVVLIHELFELKIDINFDEISKNHPAQKVV